MENLKADGQETSNFKTISISVGMGCNYSKKGSEKLSCNMVSPCPGSFGRSSFAEAKKRLEKLEQDYQHTYEKYTELQSDRYMYYIAFQRPGHHSRWVGYCIDHIENVVEQLQNVLDKLNTEEASQRGRETPTNGKQFFLTHGCKSLAQENMVLQKLKAETKEQYTDGLCQETIDVKRINWEFICIQRIVPQNSNKKSVHDLLRRVNETQKLTEKAISNGALMGNLTSLDNMKNSTSDLIKIVTNVHRELEKEKIELENILQDRIHFARKNEKGYIEKIRVLREKCKCIVERRDAEKKYLLDLEKNFRDMNKTASQRKGCRKGNFRDVPLSVQ
ncbi:unnamed protein product [Arabidopsis thaliana]|jgi:hypothetical protein|uniref:Uncharacterized protein n=4 Tax=Arabidopsis TaxID=3701 RepID=A0A384L4J7_ARATH|nr:uncharacterized protein AT3G54530 [Arabidopsis thaliana]KAG7628489.1 hypothetical protein ISN45_At03g047290 [Arabidopsis thaliana x Arabidopsis arenosa]ABE66017.1 hypothetical protein At3g54530 [Arabidopsis thaliana]AEE79246.1 hypothetical protein AT3G54530 [Arabidopsis thaliana]OAP02436.1 hypothetical protein AXX17_AT3G48970 [Arabidopsis thaliana]VYS60388.1 unnamed protein product [Arabidopsis thaliana]|eukprot:NP_191017.2 hypothetical protein AT3G54530 [Arabidopsis thaliana]